MSNLVLFPGPFLYTEKIENHTKIKEELINYIEKDAQKQEGEEFSKELRTSYHDNIENKTNETFYSIITNSQYCNDIIWKPIDNCIRQLPFHVDSYPIRSNIDQVWYNHYTSSGKFVPHCHANSFLSAIYLLHLEEKNSTVFFGSGLGHSPYEEYVYPTDHIKEGNIIIFPSHIWHYVNPTKSKRITISFNIGSAFD